MAGSRVQPGDGLRLGVVPDVPAVLVLLVDPFHGVGKGEQGRVNVKVGVPNGALYLYALGRRRSTILAGGPGPDRPSPSS